MPREGMKEGGNGGRQEIKKGRKMGRGKVHRIQGRMPKGKKEGRIEGYQERTPRKDPKRKDTKGGRCQGRQEGRKEGIYKSV
jgi:hypothetical protein